MEYKESKTKYCIVAIDEDSNISTVLVQACTFEDAVELIKEMLPEDIVE